MTEDEKSQQAVQVGRAFFYLMIWGSYMLLSKRVQSTFTRGWREPVSNREALFPGATH